MSYEKNLRNVHIIMSAICHQLKVGLEIADVATASCTKNVMKIPRAWVTSSDESVEQLLLGVTVHEAMGHLLHTNFEIYSQFCAENKPYAKKILNILEDIYCENMSITKKPGIQRALSDAIEILMRQNFFGAPETFSKADESSLLITGLLNIGRHDFISGQSEIFKTNKEFLIEKLHDIYADLWLKIWRLFEQVRFSKSTADNIAITEKIVQLVDDLIEEDPDENCSCNSNLARKLDSSVDLPAAELSDIISESISQSVPVMKTRTMEIAMKHHQRSFANNYMNVANQIRKRSYHLQELLLAKTECRRSISQQGIRIHDRAITRARLGNPAIFRKKRAGEGLSTAISILIDDSMSTKSYRSWMDGILVGLGDVLDEFEIPFEINFYSEEFSPAKNFDQEWATFRKAQKVPSISKSTVTGHAIELSMNKLLYREEQKRLLLVVTDGATNSDDMTRLFSAYSEAKNQGIEIASVMIGRQIQQINDLANRFNFSSKTCENEDQIGQYILERLYSAL